MHAASSLVITIAEAADAMARVLEVHWSLRYLLGYTGWLVVPGGKGLRARDLDKRPGLIDILY